MRGGLGRDGLTRRRGLDTLRTLEPPQGDGDPADLGQLHRIHRPDPPAQVFQEPIEGGGVFGHPDRGVGR